MPTANCKMTLQKVRRVLFLQCAFCILHYTSTPASDQQLLDRVLARIGTEAITQTDVQALIEFGLADAKSPTDPSGAVASAEAGAVRQAVERQLILREVARFPQSEPPLAAVDEQLSAMKARVGSRLDAVMRANGLDEERLRGLARETLRIQNYLEQRFGFASQVGEEEARKYFEANRDQFTRNGMPMTFEEAADEARRRAAAERRQGTMAQWLQDLVSRADVAFVTDTATTSPSAQPATPRAN
jgi:hypothetical protein